MGMIKRADIERYTRDAYVMNLSDIEARARELIDRANERARQIVEEASAERERLIADAHQQGLEQGHAEGHARGLEQGRAEGVQQVRDAHAEAVGQLINMWGDQLGAFERGRDELLEAARVQVIELAGAIAQRVVRRSIELDPSIVLEGIESVLSAITEPTRLVVRVHPDDAALASDELPAMVERFACCEHAQIVTDPSLQRGSCVACTPGGGTIDASVCVQLGRVIEALLPDGHRPGGALGLGDDAPVAGADDTGSDAREDAA